MDSLVHDLNFSSSYLHLYNTNFRSSRPRQRNCSSGRKHFSLGNRHHFCFLCFIHMPNVPASTEQEQDHCLPSSSFNFNSSLSVLASNCEVQVWAQWSNDINNFGILDTKIVDVIAPLS